MSMADPDNKKNFECCVIPSDPREAAQTKCTILERAEALGYSGKDTFALKLALEEAISNAIKHGNHSDPAKPITVRFCVTEEKITVIVRDEGMGFEPEEVPDPTTPDRLPLPNGRGIMLIRAYMDEVEFRDHGREIVFVKRRQA
jgi:serine/threonine-protein kinase RsbW